MSRSDVSKVTADWQAQPCPECGRLRAEPTSAPCKSQAAGAADQGSEATPTYRLLTRDDTIQRGDETLMDDAETWAAIPPDQMLIGVRYRPEVFRTARRRQTQTTPGTDQPRTFGGYPPREIVELCEKLASAADRGNANNGQEIASICRRASATIRFLLGEDVADVA